VWGRISEFEAVGVDMFHLDLRDALFVSAVLPRMTGVGATSRVIDENGLSWAEFECQRRDGDEGTRAAASI
jgi:hypothetical protein